LGLTAVEEAGPGVLADFSRIASTAYSVGLVRRGWFEQGDALGLVVFQPLRVADGSARLSLPVAYDYATGFAEYGDGRIDLAPSGREVGIELSYGRKVLGGAALQANLLQRFEPGHVADAEPETTALVRLKLAF
jgi:hypothetical protein